MKLISCLFLNHMEEQSREKQFKNFISSCYKHGLFLDENTIKYKVLAGASDVERKLKVIKENLDFHTLTDLDALIQNYGNQNNIITSEYKELISLYFCIPISSSFDEIIYNIFCESVPTKCSIKEIDISKSIIFINNLLNSIYYSNLKYEDKIKLIDYIDDKLTEKLNTLRSCGLSKDLLSKFPIIIQNKNLYYWYKDTNNHKYKITFIFDLDDWDYNQLNSDFLLAIKYANISPYLDSFLNNANNNKLKLLLFNKHGNCNYGISDIDLKQYVFSKNFCCRLLAGKSVSNYLHIFKKIGYIDKLIDELKEIFNEFLKRETINYYGWLFCCDLFKCFTYNINELDKDSQELLFKYDLIAYCGGPNCSNGLNISKVQFLNINKVKLYDSSLFDFIKSIKSRLDHKMYFDNNFKNYYTTLFRNNLVDLSSFKLYGLIVNITDLEMGYTDDLVCDILQFCRNIDQCIIEFAERKSWYMKALIKNKKLKTKDKRYLKVLITAGC